MLLLLSEELSSLLPVFEDFFSPFVSLGLRVWCRRRRPSFYLTTAQVSLCKFVMTEITWVSFGTLSMCFSLNTLSRFPFYAGFLYCLTLGDWSSLHNFAPDSEVSSFHHLINMKFYRCFQSWKTCPLFRMVSWSYNAKTVWSWTESCNLDSYHPSRITSEGISLADKRAWSHRTSKSWTSSFCERTWNKSECPCTASWAQVAPKCS